MCKLFFSVLNVFHDLYLTCHTHVLPINWQHFCSNMGEIVTFLVIDDGDICVLFNFLVSLLALVFYTRLSLDFR